ncbi:DUF5642 family protein [Gordonia neofelifaecis]|uniref:DUF5642 family protein n=1 Tax=Gordonia neofelifaecis TaxID=945692 RepID=UPI0002F67DDD|nr:DUF5642 family protein [Gordonia neofelifaecis]
MDSELRQIENQEIQMMWAPKRLAASLTALVAVAGVAACGAESGADSQRVDVARIATLSAPKGYRTVPGADDTDLSAKIAAQPLPPGYQVFPAHCSPQGATVSKDDLAQVKVVAFRSPESVISAVAYQDSSGQQFDDARCSDVTVTGPNGAEAMTVPVDIEAVPSADDVKGSHTVVRESADSRAYSQYVYSARVADRYRVVVYLAPVIDADGPRRPVDPADAAVVLADAVHRIVIT